MWCSIYVQRAGANVNVQDRWNNRPLDDDAQSNGHEEECQDSSELHNWCVPYEKLRRTTTERRKHQVILLFDWHRCNKLIRCP